MNPSRYKITFTAIRAFSVVLLLVAGCQPSQVPPDRVKNELLVENAQFYTTGGPTWFLAPSTCSDVIGSSNGYSQNTAGAVAWSIQIDDLPSFRQRIYNATQSNQTSWFQYTCVAAQQPCGFPFGSCVSSEDAGLVCWSLVLHALRDAGYDVPGPVGGCDYFNSRYPEVTGVVRIGDLVLYDWNGDGSYDHMGIITGNTTSADPKYYNVISVTNLVREFNLGAAQKRLGIFEDIPPSEGGSTNYNYRIVRPQ